MELQLWSLVVLAGVPAGFKFHPIASKRLRASASFSMKAHVAAVPFLLVSSRPKLVNRFLKERLRGAVIAMNHVLVMRNV